MKIIGYTQDCFKRNPKDVLTAKDSQGNRLAHLAAASGNTELFEVQYIYIVEIIVTY